MFLIADPWVRKQSTALKKTSWPSVSGWKSGRCIFTRTWFFPCALGAGDVITWALLQLLQALHSALLPELLMRLFSNPFGPSELGLFKLQVLFWPKQASEQLHKSFGYCASSVSLLSVSVPVAQLPASCLGTLKDGFGPIFCSSGKVYRVCANGNTMGMMQIHLPALDFLKIDQNIWILLNIVFFPSLIHW